MSQQRPPRPDPLPVAVDGIPETLRDHDQWVCWRYKFDTDRDEWTKVPTDATTGSYASATDPDTWASFADALAYHERDDTDTDGVGFVASDDDVIVGLDLDDCRDPTTGDLDDWAADVLDDVRTYAEVSPSGTGARLFGLGILPAEGNRADIDGAEGHLELYETGRYFTVTGQHVDGTPAAVRQVNDEITAVHAEHIVDDDAEGDSPDAHPHDSAGKVDLDDADLVERAMNAKNGDEFRRLWNGSTAGYPSHSEADLALVGHLAFWTGGDRQQIDRLFRRSGLVRDKWAERDDYRRRTIDKALDGRTEFYDPGDDGGPTRQDWGQDRDDGAAVSLTPSEVAAWAGLGEDETVADLSDRQKAAAVWGIVEQSDAVHVRVRRDTAGLWAYNGGVWTPTGERTLRHAAWRAVGAMDYGPNVLNELEAQARADPAAEIEGDALGVEPGTVAVANGLLDLAAAADGDDDALRDLRPDDYALTKLPVEYDPTAEYDEWAEYVDEWAEDGKADALQEYVGYCLHVGAMPIHRALLLVGSGANGKGTFLHVVRAMLGRENTTAIELQTLANEKDAVADFEGALANIDDDLSARQLGAGLGMFKKLVGGDRVRARRLYEAGYDFDATGKHIYAANEVPDVNVPDDDEAFWRRWLLVEFPNHYPPSKRDPGLRDRLATDEALSGVLNWAIDGWRRLVDQSHFTNEEHYAQQKRERWQAWGDSVDSFISEHVERDPDAPNITTGDAHRRYVAWCRENNEEPVGQQQFTTTMKTEDVGYATSVRVDGSVQRGYKSLGFSDEVDDLPDDDGDDDPDDDPHQQRLG